MAGMPGSDMDSIAAELAIRNLLARLAQLADSGETEKYLELLTEDVVWTMPANPAVGLQASELRGHDAIGTGQRERITAGLQGPGSDSMHVLTTTSVSVDGDTATARSHFQYWATTSTDPTIRNVGRYADELRGTPAGWKLSRRTITFG
jgi:3-phenylpropionate/cinnamic acid dioxygenase small subunit